MPTPQEREDWREVGFRPEPTVQDELHIVQSHLREVKWALYFIALMLSAFLLTRG